MELSLLNHYNLKSEFSNLFIHLFEDSKLPISSGIQCGDGWISILYSLSIKLNAAINLLPEEERSLYYVTQITEESGSLKFKLSKYTKEIKRIIDYHEKLSIGVCEVCGEEGYLLNNDGVRTSRCKDH